MQIIFDLFSFRPSVHKPEETYSVHKQTETYFIMKFGTYIDVILDMFHNAYYEGIWFWFPVGPEVFINGDSLNYPGPKSINTTAIRMREWQLCRRKLSVETLLCKWSLKQVMFQWKCKAALNNHKVSYEQSGHLLDALTFV